MLLQLLMTSGGGEMTARAALPVSAVVNTYCRQYDGSQSSDEVTQIIRQLESELRYNCRSDGSNEQTSSMLTTLRALGNAGLAASQSTLSTLDRCARNHDIPTAVRVGAINAFRRVQCSDSIVRAIHSFLHVHVKLCDPLTTRAIRKRFRDEVAS